MVGKIQPFVLKVLFRVEIFLAAPFTLEHQIGLSLLHRLKHFQLWSLKDGAPPQHG